MQVLYLNLISEEVYLLFYHMMDDHNYKESDTWNITGNARYHLVSMMDCTYPK